MSQFPLRAKGGLVAAASVTRRSQRPLELSEESDLLYDYVLEPYEPRAAQTGKLRSINLLQETFALADVDAEGAALIAAIRGGLGEFRTVWGVKHDRTTGKLRGWEFYFYDWKRVHADLSIEGLVRLLAPCVNLEAVESRPLPWHMLSVEVSPEALRSRSSVPLHVYIDMRSYELRGDRLSFENIYTFHDPRREIDDVLHRLRASVHLDLERDNLALLMPPGLFRCRTLCVANKRIGDAMYFSRVGTDALLSFLRAHRYPTGLTDWANAERDRLDHLFWDVGLDFVANDGRAAVQRTGFYGSF